MTRIDTPMEKARCALFNDAVLAAARAKEAQRQGDTAYAEYQQHLADALTVAHRFLENAGNVKFTAQAAAAGCPALSYTTVLT